jgi:hypothetical protein
MNGYVFMVQGGWDQVVESKKVTAKKSVKNQKFSTSICEISEVLLFYTTNLQKCLANNFFWVDFFGLFPQI